MDKLLTITIPVYNTEPYIKRCLDSLLIDDNMDLLDILIISDGSPDNSAGIIKEYTSRYPDVFRLIEKENGGHGSVINRGIKEAKGKYFRVLDSDDWFDKKDFADYIKQLRNLDVSLVMTNTIIEYTYKNESFKEDYHGLVNYGKIETVDDYDFNPIEGKDVVSLANATFDTKMLRETGISLYEKCFYEDLQYSLFFLDKVSSFVFLDLYVYHYFIGRPEQSVSAKSALAHYEDRYRITTSLADHLSVLFKTNCNKNGKEWLVNRYLRHLYIHYKFMLNFNLAESCKKTKQLNDYLYSQHAIVLKELESKYTYVKLLYRMGCVMTTLAWSLKRITRTKR